jgi:hypothetical protein
LLYLVIAAKSRFFAGTLGLWFLTVVVVCVRIFTYPEWHSVFPTYRDAGAAWIHQAQIYAAPGIFLYSPLVAAFFSPFALISQNVAEVLWRLLLGFALPLALWFNARTLFDFSKKEFAWLFLLIVPLTLSSLNNGQANIIIIVLFLVAAAAASQSRWLICAFCAAFAVYWKIYPIAFALLLAVVFPNKLIFRILLMLIGLFVVSLFLQKPSYTLQQYGDWLVNLASDRRRAHEYYGRWRDFYLLLRLLGIPISATWWTIVEVTAGCVAAAICFLGAIRHWPRATLLLGAMSLAIVWMLLFGPATEAATYVLIAVPSAYLLIAGWSDVSQSALRVVSTLTYLGFLSAHILNSWFPIKKNVYLVHAIQPCLTLCFCAALFLWWKRQLLNESEQPCNASERSKMQY